MRALAVVTAIVDRWESGVVAGLSRASGLDVVRRCADLPDLLAVAASGVADVVLVSAGLRGLDLTAVHDLRASGCAVVAVVDPSAGEEDERRVRQLGIEQVVAASCTADELAGAIREAARGGPDDGSGVKARSTTAGSAADDAPGAAPRPGGARPPADADAIRRGRVVTVWGATGAPGRTTVAVGIAAELAADGVQVLLVDADTHAASVAASLGMLDEVAGVATACRAAEQGTLDVPGLARIAPTVEPGLRVLTGLPRADRWTEVRQAALERVLDVSRLLVDVVVVDCAATLEDDEELSYDTLAPRRNMATLTAVDVADTVLVVGAADPIGLQRLVRAVDDLRTRGREPDRVVVTKLRRSALGAGAAAQVRQVVDRYVGGAPTTVLPWAPEVLDAAMLAGRTLAASAPTAPLRTAIRTLAADVRL